MIHPTPQHDRILILDVLRGVAVLGILIMNIQAFSMISSAYGNPTSYGDFTGTNRLVWFLGHFFADQKFMTLFSLLFGAGIALAAHRTTAAGRKPVWFHYRRMVALLVIGFLHAYLLWYGDILTLYALCGMVAYWFWRCRPVTLFILASLAILFSSLLLFTLDLFWTQLPPEMITEMEEMWAPSPETVESYEYFYRSGYWVQMTMRSYEALYTQLGGIFWYSARVGGLMLLGMALLKSGILTGQRSPRFYRSLLLCGLALGLLLETAGVICHFIGDWHLSTELTGLQFNYWASLLMAASYLAAVVLFCRAQLWPRLRQSLAATGRMAFTNYITQSLICTTIFYGHGLGLYGYLQRWQQLLLVFAIWILQVAWSVWWLRRFQHGPVEWLWRCITHLRLFSNRPQPPQPPILQPSLAGPVDLDQPLKSFRTSDESPSGH